MQENKELRNRIKEAIKTTLVIENKQSIDIAVDKIIDVLEKVAIETYINERKS